MSIGWIKYFLIVPSRTSRAIPEARPGMLENARKRLRLLVKLIEKSKKKVVYTDFIDELGTETVFDLPEVANGLAVQIDGKLVLAGQVNGDFALTRFNPDGTVGAWNATTNVRRGSSSFATLLV